MAKNPEQIFEECLERVFQGESIESCLMRYPNEAASLEPLLRTALGVTNRAATLRPDQEFKARARMRLQGAFYASAQPRPQVKHGGFAWQRSWTFALSAIVLLLFGSVGTAFASAAAMPDEPLYRAKLATEQVQLAFTFSEENKAALHASFAEQRTQEMAAMAEEGKSDYLVATAAKLTYQMEQAESAIKRLELKEAAKPVSVAVTLQPPTPAVEPAIPEVAPTTPEAAPAMAPAPTKTTDESALGVSANETVPEISTDVGKTSSKKVKRAWEKLNQSTSKNLEMLEGALDKSADEDKPALKRIINKTRETHERTLKRGIYTKPEPQSPKPEKENKGNSHDKPRPQSDQSTPSSTDTRPFEPGKTKKPADIPNQTPNTTEPSDNRTRPQYTPVPSTSSPSTSSPSTDTLKNHENTGNESDSDKSISIQPGHKYNNSVNSR